MSKIEIIRQDVGARPLFGCPLCGAIAESFFKRCPSCGQRLKERRHRRRGLRVTGNRRLRVLERDGNRCLACGATTKLTIDHVVPASRGGTSAVENLQTLCQLCNGLKKATTIDYRLAREGGPRA